MKKCFILLASALFMCSPIFGEETSQKNLTVSEAVELAFSNNITLKRQKLNLDLLEKKNSSSWNGISPTASISGGYTADFKDPVSQSWSVSGSLGLNFTPSLFTTIKNAELSYQNGQISYDAALRSIELNVRKIFYSLLYTKESLNLQKRNLETARQNYVSNRDKYNRGQLSELNLLNSQYAYESQKPALESAQINYENNLATFKQTLGIPQETEITLTGSLEDYAKLSEINIKKSVEELPAVQTIERQIEMAENNLLATRFSAWGPSLSATYSYGASGSFGSDNVRNSNSLSVNVRIPLDGYLPWSSGALNIESQKSTLEDLQLQLKNQKVTSELEVQNSLKKIKQAQSQLEALKTNISLAQRKYNATLTAYNHGSADYLSLQSASDALLTARINRQSQLYTLISTILDLENTLGIPFGTLGFNTENK